MLIIPAIDLLDGACVRLLKGDYGRSTTYSTTPEAVAREFERSGAEWIHVVDLDAARGKGRNNREVVGRIRKAVTCGIQVGGGVRTAEDVRELLSSGVNRLVLGTVLIKNPDQVAGWVSEFGPRFFGGIDALDGRVRISGWESGTEVGDEELAGRLREMGMDGVVYTNISRDGALTGPDVESTNRIAESSGLPVILSGGISSDGDVEQVFAKRHPGIIGLITGKALYEGRIRLPELIARYQRV